MYQPWNITQTSFKLYLLKFSPIVLASCCMISSIMYCPSDIIGKYFPFAIASGPSSSCRETFSYDDRKTIHYPLYKPQLTDRSHVSLYINYFPIQVLSEQENLYQISKCSIIKYIKYQMRTDCISPFILYILLTIFGPQKSHGEATCTVYRPVWCCWCTTVQCTLLKSVPGQLSLGAVRATEHRHSCRMHGPNCRHQEGHLRRLENRVMMWCNSRVSV